MTVYSFLTFGAHNIVLERFNNDGSLDRGNLGLRWVNWLRERYGIQSNQELAAAIRFQDAEWLLRQETDVEHWVPPKDSLDALAWALFRTDREVERFVLGVADESLLLRDKAGEKVGRRFEAPGSDERRDRAYAVAWERDEQGWRSAAYRRAEAIQHTPGAVPRR